MKYRTLWSFRKLFKRLNFYKNITLKILTNTNWEFDLEKQKEIALKYEIIEKIQKTLIEELEYLEKVKIEI